jgi:hypothetical protein
MSIQEEAMKKILWLLYFCVAFAYSLQAQSGSVLAFNTLIRDYDLNADMQMGYAITAVEYDRLRTAWLDLAPEDKLQLHGIKHNYWDDIYVTRLLRDLFAGATWEEHLKKMAALGARGLALTLSRYKSPITHCNTARSGKNWKL